MAIPKWGEPMSEWRPDRSHAHTIVNAFGVVDADGATIPGLQVEMVVFRAPRVVMERYVYTLFQLDAIGGRKRVYQLHVNHKKGVRPGDHEYSHEHIGAARIDADPTWASLSPMAAEQRFCVNCNLTLDPRLPDFDAYTLR
jgi:hypothetical protein